MGKDKKSSPEGCGDLEKEQILPAGFEHEMALILKEELKPFLLSLAGEAVRGIRPRTGFGDLSGDGLDPVPWAAEARYLKTGSRAGGRVFHDAGAYYLQEPSAMAPAAALRPRPGEWVLDLCAAPGGKSTQMAGMMEGRGLLLCNEVVPERAKILSGNIERMGIANALVTSAPTDRLASLLPARFDRVLVDAPCSGEGMFRRHPESRGEWNPGLPAMCAERQARILDDAAVMLKEGGTLVYSTCTFSRTENEETVKRFLSRHPDFEMLPFALPGCPPSPEGTLRIWPHRQRGEGHFLAALIRTGTAEMIRQPSLRLPQPEKQAEGILSFLRDTVPVASWDPGRIFRRGEGYVYLPEEVPELPGVRVLRCGLHLGAWKGKAFVPDHALGRAFGAVRRVDLGGEEAAAYMMGETLPAPAETRGWAAAYLEGVPLGWVKISDGLMKNHYPKGLRRRLEP
ncbi:MAG: RsmB/NOP family class I SAM-dependent RNA methyltransferase [Clostridia bacterium]|nr:RsmB/NOP family class I SAM-dependent RNA methyltransferase [Clostridia bacterium]